MSNFSAPTQSPLRGVLWMLASTLAMVGVNTVVHYLGTSLPSAQSAFIRFCWAVAFTAPWLVMELRKGITPGTMKLHIGRGIFHTLAVIFWFYAMARIPMAEVTAIGYLNPVLLTLGSAVFLGEVLSRSRVMAIAVAFVGALVVLRPGLRELELGHLSQIAASFCFASSYLFSKRLSGRVSAGLATAMMSLLVTIGLAPVAFVVWQPVELSHILWLAVTAICGTLGHFFMSKSFAAAPVAVSQPVAFVQLIWASIVGMVLFGELVDPLVIVGGALIIGAISYNTWRESRLQKA